MSETAVGSSLDELVLLHTTEGATSRGQGLEHLGSLVVRQPSVALPSHGLIGFGQ